MPKKKNETYKEHYQRYKETHLKYYRRKDIKKKSASRRKKGRENLDDFYVKEMLKRMKLPVNPQFMELYRQHLKLKRQIKQLSLF